MKEGLNELVCLWRRTVLSCLCSLQVRLNVTWLHSLQQCHHLMGGGGSNQSIVKASVSAKNKSVFDRIVKINDVCVN